MSRTSVASCATSSAPDLDSQIWPDWATPDMLFRSPRFVDLCLRANVNPRFWLCEDPAIAEVQQMLDAADPRHVWWFSDLHCGEPKFMGDIRDRPPYETPDELDEMLANKHNSVVAKDDLLVFGGDWAVTSVFKNYREKGGRHPLEVVSRFNGQVLVWMRGNHDRDATDDEIRQYTGAKLIVPEHQGVMLEIGKADDAKMGRHKCWLTHYPVLMLDVLFNLVGHVHGAGPRHDDGFINIGGDAHHLLPWSGYQIAVKTKAVKANVFYDDDCHLAQLAACRKNTTMGPARKHSSYLLETPPAPLQGIPEQLRQEFYRLLIEG